MKKLSRTEIAVIVVFVLVIVTLNSWWRVKVRGRQLKMYMESHDAGLVHDGGRG